MVLHYALALSICFFVPAHAQMSDVTCDDRTRMAHMLTHDLGAERQGRGLRDPETLLEIWVTQRNGDWIIVQNYTNGTSCIVAMGEHWEGEIPEPV
ncbi:hypothetical protein [Roseobacter litoralis]|uniref:Uncharacterized protein n=1 Tax=Roseobacter litoralis (strain ATCC 49566 / DSM 6996 / JCM 21268 / NBRC 15278 / OCh 149) TaxID=391595 RepID=F7ZHS6_ROSLO|nr:hypothetical protein [Roseobacter litoralis]AEI93686.1 hypothetical protein RLO149_c016940 [Roseobacter litoralis Och 149]